MTRFYCIIFFLIYFHGENIEFIGGKKKKKKKEENQLGFGCSVINLTLKEVQL